MPNNQKNRKSDIERRGIFYYAKNNFYLIILITVILILLTIIISTRSMNVNKINDEKNAIFEQPWNFSINDGNYHQVILPSSKKLPFASHITLKNKLPIQATRGATILLRTSQQKVRIYIDNDFLYSSSEIPSSAYHLVRLPKDYAGKEIIVVLSSPFKQYSGLMNQIYIGSKTSNLFFLFHENGLRFFIGFVIFIIGFMVIAVFLFTNEKKNKLMFTYLGAFFVSAGYWLLVESRMAQIFIPYPVALTSSSIFALTLLPVFSSLYYYTSHITSFYKLGKIVVALTTIISFFIGIISCINPILSIQIFPLYLVFVCLYVIAVFILVISESVKNGKFLSLTVCGILLVCGCGFLELIFYFVRIKNYNNSNFFTLGLILFCIMMVIDSVQRLARVYQEAVKVNTLTTLAYTDSLTGLKNRTAFLEKMSTANLSDEEYVTIAMFDIDNLKMVNDALGHLVGDAMLRHCAKVLKNSIRQGDELYRIGGDEFVSIIFHDQELSLEQLGNRLCCILKKGNEDSQNYDLNISYGYATFSKKIDKNLFDTLARADEKMYACKKIQKSKYK